MSTDAGISRTPPSASRDRAIAAWSDPLQAPRPTSRHAVLLLQAYGFILFVVPNDVVLLKISGALYPAGLIGLAAFGLWLASSLFGLHDPRDHPNPARFTFLVLWAVTFVSYAFMAMDQALPIEVRAADRWMIQLASWTGIAMVAAESLNSLKNFQSVIRALSWGGAVCGLVAALQFWISIDLATYLRWVPLFDLNGDNLGIDSRGSLNRVAGTALHPIELGVTAATLLPLAIYGAMHATTGSKARKWLPVALIAAGIPVSVSRSAIVALAVALVIFIACLSARQRVLAFLVVPVAIVGVFITAPGLLGTLKSFFLMGSNESSFQARENDIPTVVRLVKEHPWFGRGANTYQPPNIMDNFDNQYYRFFVEVGLVGTFLVTIAYFVAPPVIAFVARKRSTDPATRLLGGALGAGAAVGLLVTFTFDSLGYPMYAGLHALLVGMIGAYWRLCRAEERHRTAPRVAAAPRSGSVPTLYDAGEP